MIRRGLVTLALIGLTLALLAVVTVRAVDMKTSLVPDLEEDETEESMEEQTPSGPVLHVPSPPPERPRQVQLLERPLVVVGLSWERLAPALIANVGREPNRASAFAPSGLAVAVQPKAAAGELVDALARGGDDEQGADLAVVSLPTWVSVHDRVAAIDPVVFYVAGWSRGREGVLATSVVDAGTSDATTERIVPSDLDAAYLALFGLDVERAGAATIVDEQADPAPTLHAVDLLDTSTAPGARPRLRWTTARASGLIPIVMVASRPWVESHPEALVAWLRGWLFGVGEMSGQTAPAARRLGKMKEAPAPLRLMRGLQMWEPSSLSENLVLFELDGPCAQPLRLVMARTWSLMHKADLAAGPPRTMPLHVDILRSAYLLEVGGNVGAWVRQRSVRQDSADGWQTVVSRPLVEVDGFSLAKDLALLGSVYPTAVLQVVPKEKDGPVQRAFEVATELSSVPQTVVLGDPNPDLTSSGTIDVLVSQ